MKLQESGEMYLETIYVLSQDNPEVHSVDVAAEMGFSKPSVSRAVNLLKDHGYLDIDKGGKITLTEEGLAVADDACRIEYVISPESFERVKEYFADITKDK